MKTLTTISIILLILVVITSGCTSNTTSNKTYSSQGITFQYPSTYTLNNDSTLLKKDNTTIGIDNLGSLNDFTSQDTTEETTIPATLDAAATELTENYTGENKKEITVAGVPAIQYIPSGSGRQRTDVIFVSPNGTLYQIWMTTDSYNIDKSTFEGIINSLKIN